MGSAQRSPSRRRSAADRIADARLLADHHIAGIRYTRKGRKISHILHPVLGWIKVRDYYYLQKIHDAMPAIVKVIEGGYRIKAALWSMEASIPLKVPLSVPIGLAWPLAGLVIAQQKLTAGDQLGAALTLAALALPFGEIYLAIEIFSEAAGLAQDLGLANPDGSPNLAAGVLFLISPVIWIGLNLLRSPESRP